MNTDRAMIELFIIPEKGEKAWKLKFYINHLTRWV